MELICEYKDKAEELWKWARPFIIERAGNMFGNLYKKSILAAETVNDDFSGGAELSIPGMEKACWDITVDWMKNTGFRNDTGLGEYIGTGEETA